MSIWNPPWLLWRVAISVGAMKESEAVDKFVELFADNLKPSQNG